MSIFQYGHSQITSAIILTFCLIRHSSADPRSGQLPNDDGHAHMRQMSVDFSTLNRHGSQSSIARTPSTHSMSRLSVCGELKSISRPVPYESLSSRLASAQPIAGKHVVAVKQDNNAVKKRSYGNSLYWWCLCTLVFRMLLYFDIVVFVASIFR